MVEQEVLERLFQEQPVLSFAAATFGTEPRSELSSYLASVQAQAGSIPQTLTEFYQGFTHYVILDYIAKNEAMYCEQWEDAEIGHVTNTLAQIAYNERFRKLKMVDAVLRKCFNVIETTKVDVVKSEITHLSFGLLVRDRTNKIVTYKFRDNGMQNYFISLYQRKECERKWKVKSVRRTKSDTSLDDVTPKNVDVSQSLRDSINMLPATGAIWRMTFGLLSQDPDTVQYQRFLMQEVIQRSVYNIMMTSFDITSLCIDLVYETQNRSQLAEYIDNFTVNQTICYSNVMVGTSHIPYILSSTGFFLHCCPDLFGLYLSDFRVSSTHAQALANPRHPMENSLQVLNLSENPLGDSGVRHLQTLLLKATRLTHLDLSKCEFGNEGMLYISECVINLPLLFLRVADNQISDEGLKPFIRRMKYCGPLELLDLSGNKLTDSSVIPLGRALGLVYNLRSLDLRRNPIGEAGLDAVSRGLKKSDKVLNVVHEEQQKSSSAEDGQGRRPLWQTKSIRNAHFRLNQRFSYRFPRLKRPPFAEDLREDSDERDTELKVPAHANAQSQPKASPKMCYLSPPEMVP